MKRNIHIEIDDNDTAGYFFLLRNGYLNVTTINDETFEKLIVRYSRDGGFVSIVEKNQENFERIWASMLSTASEENQALQTYQALFLLRLYDVADSSTKQRLSEVAYRYKDAIRWATYPGFLKVLPDEVHREVLLSAVGSYDARTRLSVILKLCRHGLIGATSKLNIGEDDVDKMFTDEELKVHIFCDRHFVDVEPIVFKTGRLADWYWLHKTLEV